MTSKSIDELLAGYLGLLHEYTELRSQLATHQTSMYGNLARANFAAERGFRYGPDNFDGRMQALVRLTVTEDNSGSEPAASFTVTRPKIEVKAEAVEDDKENKESEEKKPQQEETDNSAKPKSKKNNKKKEPAGPRDPLQWFGVLTPMALRQAQHEAIEVIDTIVPRLATLNAEMAAVEIEVRRARKKRARTATSQEKGDKTTTTKTTREAAVSV